MNFDKSNNDIFNMIEKENLEDNDEKVFDRIITDLENYNVLDFISRVAILNLNPYNQNKSMIFDKILDCVLCSKLDFQSNKNKMSNNKFNNLINLVMSTHYSQTIDPIEMPFIQRVQYYGNKWIFSGINHSPAYILQNLINVLHNKRSDINQDFMIIIDHFIHFTLQVSTKIVERLKYTEDVFEHHEINKVIYPSSEEINKLTNSIVFDEDDFDGVFDDDFREIVYYNVGNKKKVSCEFDNFSFYYSPFLKLESNKFIVLNPTILVPFLIHRILYYADKFGVKDLVVDWYNNKTWYECKKSLEKLGHKKLLPSQFEFEPLNLDCYKEAIYSASNDGILFVRYFCDDTRDYDFSNMFTLKYLNVDFASNRLEDLIKSDKILKKQKIYQMIIINTIGRGLNILSDIKQYDKTVSLTPFELYCVAINETNHSNFILKYIDSKNKLLNSKPPFVDEINYICLFSDNEYSFYINDDVDTRKTTIYPGYGDSVDYLNKAILKIDKQLADIPESECYKEIELLDKERKIYIANDTNKFLTLTRFKNIDIWFSTEKPSSLKQFDLARTIIDLMTYWFGECNQVIEMNKFIKKTILIQNYFDDEVDKYFIYNYDYENNLSSQLKYTIKEEIIKIYWKPEIIINLVSNKLTEKELINYLISILSNYTNEKFNLDCIEYVFDNPLKRRIYFLDYINRPFLKPIDEKYRCVCKEYENFILDEIGDYLREEKKYKYGVIKDIPKNYVCNEIVSFLYKKLQEMVKMHNKKGFYELLYLDLESIIYHMMLVQRRYSYELACYPERSKEINDAVNEINKSSIATKFLLEYISAVPPSGNDNLGECDYEYMLAICSLIIEWAHNSDLFKYKMIDNDLIILNSGRIGLKKKDINRFYKANYLASRKRLEALSNPNIDIFTPERLEMSNELDKAFIDEFKYSYTELNKCIMEIIEIGNDIHGEVKKIKYEDFLDLLIKRTLIKEEKVNSIINDLSLYKRKDFLKPHPPFDKNDVLPWKFNRRLSFIRRPIILVDGELIWGNRQLYHSFRFLQDLILSGKLTCRNDGLLNKYISKKVTNRGDKFNKKVFEKINKMDGVNAFIKVRKINGKKIVDSNGQELGDIDVLAIINSKKKIIAFEVKDFSFAKTPYEMYHQYLNVFLDNQHRLSYMSRHKKRVDWLKDNIQDLKQHYNLQEGNWKVVKGLIVDEPILSNDFYHKKENIVLYTELSKEYLNKIK